MSIGLPYPDTITIFETTPGAYAGQETIVDEGEVACIFQQATGRSHGNSQDAITAGVSAFVDPDDSFIINHANRLEGMLVVAKFAGLAEAYGWYRITDVIISRDSLLDNRIDNIQLALEKSSSIRGIS